MAIREITTGQDSFLDIIANLIGILIILVVVVGAQAKSAWQPEQKVDESIEKFAEVEQEIEKEIEKAKATSAKLMADNTRLERQLKMESVAAAAATERRHRLLMEQEVLKQQIAERKSQFDDQRQKEIAERAQLAELEDELQEIRRAATAVAYSQATREEVIEHYPTPIAKTVFSDEVHLRLKRGRLSFVPLEPLLELMRNEWRVKAETLRQFRETVETVGPIEGYRLQYGLATRSVMQKTEYGQARSDVIDFKGFMVLPTDPNMGEPVDSLLQEGTPFMQRINGFLPGKTTFSIWVYPDSFNEFNQLKRALHQRGFQTASWPLSEKAMISGGPDGFRTSAQ